MDQRYGELAELASILERWKWHFAVTAIAAFVLGTTLVLLIPSVYRSEALILIEEPNLPPDVVGTTISGFAAYRVKSLAEKVTAFDNLTPIVKKFGLYGVDPASPNPEFAVGVLRQSIDLQLKSAEDRKSRGRPEAIISFTLAFEYGDPQIAQEVVQDLVALFVSEDVRTRQEGASETAALLAAEANRLEGELTRLDEEIAELRLKYPGSLPDEVKSNVLRMSFIQQELQKAEVSLAILKQRQNDLSSSLTIVDPYQDGTSEGRFGLTLVDKLVEQLNAKRVEYTRLESSLKPQHPTMLQLAAEIQTLERSVDAERRLAQRSPNEATPDNPVYLQLKSESDQVATEIEGLVVRSESFRTEFQQLEQKNAMGPSVEQEYNRIKRSLDATVERYREIGGRQLQAQMGESLEDESGGERFSLREPPALPTSPVRPNRIILMGIVFVFAVGCGAAVTMIFEVVASAVYSVRQVTSLAGVPPLALIPNIPNHARRRGARKPILLASGNA